MATSEVENINADILATEENQEQAFKQQLLTILNTKQRSHTCDEATKCEALECMTFILQHYQTLRHSAFARIVQQTELDHKPFLLDSYHHILRSHLAECAQAIQPQCTASECLPYFRHAQRDRDNKSIQDVNEQKERPQVEEDEEIKCYIDIMDTIHCNIVHTQHNKILRKLSMDGNDKNHNKYFTESDGSTSTSSFDCGYKYYYWEHFKYNESPDNGANAGYKKGQFYIHRKHQNLKAELLSNDGIQKKKFDETRKKAERWMESEVVKAKKSNEAVLSEYCCIRSGSPIKVDNLLVVALYTDFTGLSAAFSSTFRKTDRDESIEDTKKRNSEFWHWSKTLIETVELYGTSMQHSTVKIFYHGVSQMTFPSFLAYFAGPTSTTKKKGIAAGFCGERGEGVILELVKENKYSVLRYFDVSWLSAFSSEDERLFIWGTKPLKFESIHLIKTQKNYDPVDCRPFILAFTLFDYVLNGKKLTQSGRKQKKYTKQHAQIIGDLLKHQDPTTDFHHKFDAYITDTFTAFANNKKEIFINFAAINEDYPFMKEYVTSQTNPNLLLIDKFAQIFINCTTITISPHCILDKSSLKELQRMLTTINNKQTICSLRKININSATYDNGTSIKCVDDNFRKKHSVEFPQCKLAIELNTSRNNAYDSPTIIASNLIISLSGKHLTDEMTRGQSTASGTDKLRLQITASHSNRAKKHLVNPTLEFSTTTLWQATEHDEDVSDNEELPSSVLTPITPSAAMKTHLTPHRSVIRQIKVRQLASLGADSFNMVQSYSHDHEDPFDDHDDRVVSTATTQFVSDLDGQDKDDGIGIYNYKARAIWMAASAAPHKTASFAKLYPYLVQRFRKSTGFTERTPTEKELEPFFRGSLQSEADEKMESLMEPHEFNSRYLWFVGMCHIASDFQHIYDKKEVGIMAAMFYTEKQSDDTLKTQKIGTFLLRFGPRRNALMISYKDKENKVQHVLCTRVEEETYRFGYGGKEMDIFFAIKNSTKLMFLYIAGNKQSLPKHEIVAMSTK